MTSGNDVTTTCLTQTGLEVVVNGAARTAVRLTPRSTGQATLRDVFAVAELRALCCPGSPPACQARVLVACEVSAVLIRCFVQKRRSATQMRGAALWVRHRLESVRRVLGDRRACAACQLAATPVVLATVPAGRRSLAFGLASGGMQVSVACGSSQPVLPRSFLHQPLSLQTAAA